MATTIVQYGQPPANATIDRVSDAAPIFDIRQKKAAICLQSEIRAMLNVGEKERMQIPFELLYDEKGLQLFDEICHLEDYYPTPTELEVLEKYIDQMAGSIQEGSIISFHRPSPNHETDLEVPSARNLRKVNLLLQALDRAGKKNIRYFALDLDEAELVRTLAQLPTYKNVSCFGLWGSYEDGFRWLNSMNNRVDPVTVLFLGSSIGNFSRANARAFMKSISDALRPELHDAFIIAFDHCSNFSKIWKAYHDSNGVHEKFIINALRHANSVMGHELFDLDAWRAGGEIDRQHSCHNLFFHTVKDTAVGAHSFQHGERIPLGQNIKYPREEVQRLFHDVGLQQAARWDSVVQDYSKPFTGGSIASTGSSAWSRTIRFDLLVATSPSISLFHLLIQSRHDSLTIPRVPSISTFATRVIKQ
ncbi:hypothetical protein MMC07_001603 [Pseudocyphellaria aurata]|nr:hypothetical protein [Pseudocyphellaria aurata]